MRQIKFRGQSVEGKEWFTGSYQSEPCPNITFINSSNELDAIEINPDTVGQFTGLTDKNAKEIYEGDIVLYKGAHGYVVYDNTTVMFMIRFPLLRSVYSFDTLGVPAEIIGNIHDNPELLKYL